MCSDGHFLLLLLTDHSVFLSSFICFVKINASKWVYLLRFRRYSIYSISRPGRLLTLWTLRVGAYSRWALIRGWALIKFFCLQDGRLFEVGANSRLGAYSNKYGISPFLDLAEQEDFTKYIPIQDFIDDNRRVRDQAKY